MNFITQKPSDWYKHISSGSIDIESIEVSDGGLLLMDGTPNLANVVKLNNVCNKASTGNSKYFVMLWPTSPHLIPKFTWDNSGIPNHVFQGPNEAAARFKVSDGYVHSVLFEGRLDSTGHPIKQIVQVRSVDKQFVFDRCEFINGWTDIGQQKIAQPDGSSVWDTAQHVKLVIFENCKFHKNPPGSLYPVSRQPGVDKIEFINCFDQSGVKFSKII